jgi:hypothetical protein
MAAQPNGDEESRDDPVKDEGGESACLAHLLCAECGVVLDGGAHAADCSFGPVA